jgi:hypothetical protein
MGIKKASNFRREGRNPKLSSDLAAPSEIIPTRPAPSDQRPTKPAPQQTPRRVATDFALRDTDPRLPRLEQLLGKHAD